MKHKRITAAALMLAVCILAGVLLSTRVDAAAAPSLFHNDERWYRDNSAGLEIVGEVYYVPVDIFGMFSQIELSMDNRRGEFMLYNRETKHYISVLYEEKIATVNGEEEIYLNLYRLHGGYFYVPAEYFCSVLSLSCEVMTSSSSAYGVTLRISDGAQTKTFDELLSGYDPAELPLVSSDTDTGTPAPPVTAPPPVTSGADTVPREDYLTFNTVAHETFTDVLTALREAQIHAAFFFTAEEMREYPEKLIAVTAGGHTVGLTCAAAASAEDFLAQLSDANELLRSITKTETRIAQLPGGTAKSGFGDEALAKIAEAGYVLWDWTYDVPDSVGYSVSYVDTVCRRAVGESEVNVLRMSCNKTVAQLLPGFIRYLQSAQNHTVRVIRAAAAEIRFAAP